MLCAKFALCFVNRAIILPAILTWHHNTKINGLCHQTFATSTERNFEVCCFGCYCLCLCFFFMILTSMSHHRWKPLALQQCFRESRNLAELVLEALCTAGGVYRPSVALQMSLNNYSSAGLQNWANTEASATTRCCRWQHVTWEYVNLHPNWERSH